MYTFAIDGGCIVNNFCEPVCKIFGNIDLLKKCVLVCSAPTEGMQPMDNQQKTMMWTNSYMDSGIQSGATTNVSINTLRLSPSARACLKYAYVKQ